MKPLLLYLNIVGPIENREIGETVHQIEMGITRKDSAKPDMTRMAVPTATMGEALDIVVPNIKAFIEKYYPQPK